MTDVDKSCPVSHRSDQKIQYAVRELSFMSLDATYRGVACPVVTPFADGTVDEAALGDVVDWLVENGVTGVMPVGTTGEFASLSDAEYARAVETTVEAADGRVPVFPGALATSVPRTLEHLETLADAGADAGVITTPYFYTAKGPEGNERFLRAVADRSPLPLLFYNQPRFTGSTISIETVRALATHENVVGLKDSGGDMGYFSKVVRDTSDDFLAFQGFDNLLLAGSMLGGAGGIVALANAIPERVVAAFEAADAGDMETALAIHNDQLLELFDLCYDYGFATVSKEVLAMRDVIPSAAVRPPLVELDENERQDVRAFVADIT